MVKYLTLYYLKNKKGLEKKISQLRKGLRKFCSFMFSTYQNLEFFQINKTLTDRAYLLVLLLIFVFQFCFPKYSGLAYQTAKETLAEIGTNIINSLPVAAERDYRELYVTATAYSSTVGQTDSTPCHTANGYNLCANNTENIIACNFLPLGTKVVLPDIDPDRVFTVQDRMHPRFANRIDLWMTSTQKARSFGVKILKMKIYE